MRIGAYLYPVVSWKFILATTILKLNETKHCIQQNVTHIIYFKNTTSKSSQNKNWRLTALNTGGHKLDQTLTFHCLHTH